jgi:hypothetical protein
MMRNRKIIVLLLTLLLLGAAVLIAIIQMDQEDTLPLSVQIFSNERTENIYCWKDSEGAYYVFLPTYADLSEMKFHLDTSVPVWLDGRWISDGDICEGFQLNIPYELSYSQYHKVYKTTLTFMQSANIATVYMKTASQSMDYIHAEKGNEETGTISIYDCNGRLNYEGTQLSVKGRGNATWTDSEKKSYSLMLSDETNLLGMGKAQKWILLANGLDESNLRNKIVYEFANKIGLAYSPETRWVDLYLNGEYAGLYLLCERNEVHPERVDIAHENSFLISSELEYRLKQQNYPYILTSTNLAMRIHYPDVVSEDVTEELSAKWRAIENAILAGDSIDPDTGKSWQDLIDMDSWARKYLIDEVFGNLDGYLISQYYYIDGNEEDGKVYSGPVWDYDAAIGNAVTWQLENPYSFFVSRPQFRPGVDTTLIYMLSQKEAFIRYVKELYTTDVEPEIEFLLTEAIYVYTSEIEASAAMNQIRWSVEEDIASSREYIIEFLTKRNDFLRDMWIEGATYHRVRIDQGLGTIYAYFAVPSGSCLTELPEFESSPYQDPLGLWYYLDTGEPFDIQKPITEDIEIYSTWKDSTNKKIGQITKLMPLCVIAVIGVILVIVEVRRWRKRR